MLRADSYPPARVRARRPCLLPLLQDKLSPPLLQDYFTANWPAHPLEYFPNASHRSTTVSNSLYYTIHTYTYQVLSPIKRPAYLLRSDSEYVRRSCKSAAFVQNSRKETKMPKTIIARRLLTHPEIYLMWDAILYVTLPV